MKKKQYLLDGSLVDTTAFVDEMSSSSGLAGIDVADNDATKHESERVQRMSRDEKKEGNVHIDVCLLFTHVK
jgi:hypothetical protein